MRALVVGLGSIGRRHLANLRQIAPAADITVWRQHSPPSRKVPPEATRVVFCLEDALAANPEFAVIASPAASHIETAMLLAERGIHVMIEKPLSDRLDATEDLIRCCAKHEAVLVTAYHLRFSRSLQRVKDALAGGAIGRAMSLRAEVGQYLPEWRPDSDYREGVSAQRKLGGGVVLELSHELDYARWLMGEVVSVIAFTGRLSDLEIDVEDTAEILLNFESGAVGSVHLDMAQRSRTRACRIVGTTGTLTWDGLSNEVRLFSEDGWRILFAGEAISPNEMYLAEVRHFLRCIEGSETPVVSGSGGRRVLEIALAALESSRSGRKIGLQI